MTDAHAREVTVEQLLDPAAYQDSVRARSVVKRIDAGGETSPPGLLSLLRLPAAEAGPAGGRD